MTCRDVEHLLIPYASGATIPPQAAEHVAGCERCRSVAAALSATDASATPPPEQLVKIKAEILTDLRPVKRLASAAVIFWTLILIVIGVAGIGVLALGTAGWHALDAVQKIAVFTVLAGGSVLLAISLGRQIVPGSRTLLSPPLAVIAIAGIIGVVFVIFFHPHHERTFVATGLVCLRIGIECAIGAAALCWLVLRTGAILNPLATGALSGALAGLAGLVVLEVFCPNLNEYHVLAWHLGAATASILGGALIGFIAERWRPVGRRK